jgi:hypothetical protein
LGFGFWAASKVVAGSYLGLACEIVGALAEEVCIILDTVRIYLEKEKRERVKMKECERE